MSEHSVSSENSVSASWLSSIDRVANVIYSASSGTHVPSSSYDDAWCADSTVPTNVHVIPSYDILSALMLQQEDDGDDMRRDIQRNEFIPQYGAIFILHCKGHNNRFTTGYKSLALWSNITIQRVPSHECFVVPEKLMTTLISTQEFQIRHTQSMHMMVNGNGKNVLQFSCSEWHAVHSTRDLYVPFVDTCSLPYFKN